MKLLIIGSRTVVDFDFTPYVGEEIDLIISGGAKGIDKLAEAFADRHQISKLIIYPQYRRYGKAAPIKRNRQMVDFADAVLAVWDGHSKGTLGTIRYAQKQQKHLTIVTVNT